MPTAACLQPSSREAARSLARETSSGTVPEWFPTMGSNLRFRVHGGVNGSEGIATSGGGGGSGLNVFADPATSTTASAGLTSAQIPIGNVAPFGGCRPGTWISRLVSRRGLRRESASASLPTLRTYSTESNSAVPGLIFVGLITPIRPVLVS